MSRNCYISYAIKINIVNCGHPELLLTGKANDSVPNVEGYDGLPIKGSTIMFNCPSDLFLTGSSLATCTETGEWEPDIRGLSCNDTKGCHELLVINLCIGVYYKAHDLRLNNIDISLKRPTI